MSTAVADASTKPVRTSSFPRLHADLLLMHAPAFFDFRNREDIYFPFLGTSGDVPITPLYEYFPVGFKTLHRYLEAHGHSVRLLNLSTVLLRYPRVDVDMLLRSLDVRVIGIDLHWMVHVQGSLAVARRIKEVRPDILVIFGGISSTYYAEQLIQYPFVDMVMRGYDTHAPMDTLLTSLRHGRAPQGVPNLIWKDTRGEIHDNDFSYVPDTYSCGIDWSHQPSPPKSNTMPIREVLSTQNAGCAYNCGWCGGSREAFRRINKRTRAMARKSPEEIAFELNSLKPFTEKDGYHFYSVGSYNEPASGMHRFLDFVEDTPLRSISYEQYHLTPDDILKRMAKSNKRTIITLSPESHDPRVAKLAGRGVYTNEEMEDWCQKALDLGIYHSDIWYFIGMPEQ
ncbi:MAG: cobalamin-dependent protein, partial [Candidatus Hydrogenedentes bacterium]|nr:cobalamin-dependent protein [Candidatus Hydrogenedentota bacterium]